MAPFLFSPNDAAPGLMQFLHFFIFANEESFAAQGIHGCYLPAQGSDVS